MGEGGSFFWYTLRASRVHTLRYDVRSSAETDPEKWVGYPVRVRLEVRKVLIARMFRVECVVWRSGVPWVVAVEQ